MNFINLLKHMRKRALLQQITSSRTKLFRTAYAWCHDSDVADVVVQQTLCNALQNQMQIHNITALNEWLFKTLTRCFANHARRNKDTFHEQDHFEIEHSRPQKPVCEEQIVKRVRDAIKSIPLKQRQVITLVDFERFSYLEVANILNIPVGTVMSRLIRARQHINKRLVNVQKNQGMLRTNGEESK